MKSQTGKKSVILVQEFHKFGLVREALRSPGWFPKPKRTDTRTDNIASPLSAESFHEAKAVKATIEAKRAEAFYHAHRIRSVPR